MLEKNNSPKVSVIMAAYNAASTIRESIDSVLNQTYANWELIIVNDASTDTTLLVLEEYQDARIKCVNLETNKGLPFARNAGLRESDGEFVAFLDSDDLWHEKMLETHMAFHVAHPEISISHSDYKTFNKDGETSRFLNKLLLPSRLKEGNLLPALYYTNLLIVIAVVAKRDVIEQAGLFDDKLRYGCEDYDLWIRIAQLGYKFHFIDIPLSYYRISQGSMSRTINKFKKARRFILKKYVIDNAGISDSIRRRSLANYYRYFGKQYFKNNDFALSKCYFAKSLAFEKISLGAAECYLKTVISSFKLVFSGNIK